MATERLPDPSDPEAVGRAEFATQFRGFDQLQVRSYLKVVARELQRAQQREQELVREVASLEQRVADAERAATDIDEAVLTARLGEETARVLDAARAAAADKLRRAEESSYETLASATAEAERILESAQTAVDAEIEAARARGQQLVTEALLVRERTLEDLALRRRTIRTQVEQLRAGRDRLLASHGALRDALDAIERELAQELPEARVAAELTGRHVQHEPVPSAAVVEMEIAEARDAGTPIVSDEDIAARVEQEPAQWVNAATSASVEAEPEPVAPVVIDEPTDEIPVLDHFDELARPEIVLAEVGHRRRDHPELPREPVPVVVAPDDVEEVRVVSGEPAPEVAEAAEPAADTAAEHALEPDEPDEPEEAPAHAVDDLFARIRESRAETVAKAREVLERPLESPVTTATVVDAPVGSEPEPEPTEEPEPPAELTDEQRRFAARDEAVEGIEALVARKLKRLLADEQNELQDLVRRKQGEVGHVDVVGERAHHAGRYVAAVGGELLAAVSAGSSFYDSGGQAADADLSALDEQLARELLDPLRLLLERAVDATAGDEEELLERLRSAYREVKSQRVETASRAVTLSAFNLGILTTQPEGAWVRWAVDPSTGCSPDCDDNSLAGAVVAGEPFPTGALYPPNHPGCRCLLVPADL